MTGWLVVATAWLLVLLLLAGVGAVIWMGIDVAVRGWQLLEQQRRDRQDREQGQ
jgi:threonine/homoserine/homoserine lactone efflux protein